MQEKILVKDNVLILSHNIYTFYLRNKMNKYLKSVFKLMMNDLGKIIFDEVTE